MLTQALIAEFYFYDVETGNLIHRKNSNVRKAGLVAGSPNPFGYQKIGLKGKVYSAHRMVWILFHGEIPEGMCIDHINGNKSDNRISNLRLVTQKQNMENTRKPVTNISGYKGVSWWKSTSKWKAQISHGGKKYHIGLYETKEEARDAYERKAKEFFTHYQGECNV